MKSSSPLVISPELQMTCHILLITCAAEKLNEPALLFRELKRDIRKRQIDVGTSEEALFEWFHAQCVAVIRSLPGEWKGSGQ